MQGESGVGLYTTSEGLTPEAAAEGFMASSEASNGEFAMSDGSLGGRLQEDGGEGENSSFSLFPDEAVAATVDQAVDVEDPEPFGPGDHDLRP